MGVEEGSEVEFMEKSSHMYVSVIKTLCNWKILHYLKNPPYICFAIFYATYQLQQNITEESWKFNVHPADLFAINGKTTTAIGVEKKNKN